MLSLMSKLLCCFVLAHESTTLALYGGLVTHGLLSAAMDGQLKLWCVQLMASMFDALALMSSLPWL